MHVCQYLDVWRVDRTVEQIHEDRDICWEQYIDRRSHTDLHTPLHHNANHIFTIAINGSQSVKERTTAYVLVPSRQNFHYKIPLGFRPNRSNS